MGVQLPGSMSLDWGGPAKSGETACSHSVGQSLSSTFLELKQFLAVN